MFAIISRAKGQKEEREETGENQKSLKGVEIAPTHLETYLDSSGNLTRDKKNSIRIKVSNHSVVTLVFLDR